MSLSTVLVISTLFTKEATKEAAHLILDVDLRYPPTLLCILGTNSQALKLSTSIVYVPTVELILWGLWLVAERQQLVESSYLARQCANTVIYIASLLLVREKEGKEGEVATSYADGWLLAHDGWAGFQAAVINHRIRDPYFFLPGRFCVWRSAGRLAWEVAKDDVVGHEVEGAVEARSSAQKVDIFDLNFVSHMFVLQVGFVAHFAHAYPLHGRQARVSQLSKRLPTKADGKGGASATQILEILQDYQYKSRSEKVKFVTSLAV